MKTNLENASYTSNWLNYWLNSPVMDKNMINECFYSNLKNTCENQEELTYTSEDIIKNPEDKRLVHLKGKQVFAGNSPTEVLEEANGKASSPNGFGATRPGKLYRFISKDTSSNKPFIVQEVRLSDSNDSNCSYIHELNFPYIIIKKETINENSCKEGTKEDDINTKDLKEKRMSDLNTIRKYLSEEIKKIKDETMSYLYYNFKAEEGEETQRNTLNFLVGQYTSLVNTLKKVETLLEENNNNEGQLLSKGTNPSTSYSNYEE